MGLLDVINTCWGCTRLTSGVSTKENVRQSSLTFLDACLWRLTCVFHKFLLIQLQQYDCDSPINRAIHEIVCIF